MTSYIRRNGYIIEGPPIASYSSIYDSHKYPELSIAMNNDNSLRKILFKPIHQVFLEYKVDIGLNTRDIIKEVDANKENLGDDNASAIIKKIKDLQYQLMKKLDIPSIRIFIRGVNEALFTKAIQMRGIETSIENQYFSTVIKNSYHLNKLIELLFTHNILYSGGTTFTWCNRCNNTTIGTNTTCQRCGSKNCDNYEALQIPTVIFDEWAKGGDKFIEGMIYHALKNANLDNINVLSNLDVKDKKRVLRTEADIVIPELDTIILATKNPNLAGEKKQAKLFYRDMGLRTILVTTHPNAGGMRNNLSKYFSDIKNDNEFPGNLIEYLETES